MVKTSYREDKTKTEVLKTQISRDMFLLATLSHVSVSKMHCGEIKKAILNFFQADKRRCEQ